MEPATTIVTTDWEAPGAFDVDMEGVVWEATKDIRATFFFSLSFPFNIFPLSLNFFCFFCFFGCFSLVEIFFWV